jgi:type II secretory pathway pseudopilin PulG
MLIAAVVVICVVLLILAFLLPRLSSYPQRGVDETFSAGQRGASHAPGRLGRWLQKPFSSSRKAADKSAGMGRRGRSRLPF